MPAKRKRMSVERGFRPSRTDTLKRKQLRQQRLVRVPKNRLAFPQSMKTKLRYTERIEFAPTSTSVLQYQFVGNGLYDPNLTGTGHQPRGFDELMALYKTYTVLGSKCTVQFMFEGYNGPSLKSATGNLTQNISNSENVPALTPVACGLHKGVEALAAGTYVQQMEKDRTQWGYITGAGGQPLTLSMKGSNREMLGKKFSVGGTGYTGTETTNPAEFWRYEVWAGRVADDYPQDECKVVANVIIEFDTVFTEPKTLSES